MGADDLLCSRNAWPQKALVGRAQWKINQPPSLRDNERAWKGKWRDIWHGLCARRAPTIKRWSLDARNGNHTNCLAECW